MQVFGRGHQVIRNRAMVSLNRCQAVKVIPRTHTYCSNEIPAEYKGGTNAFVDPISYVIQPAAAPVRCKNIAPPSLRLKGRWYCAYPQLQEVTNQW
jgi:hypothetical protein